MCVAAPPMCNHVPRPNPNDLAAHIITQLHRARRGNTCGRIASVLLSNHVLVRGRHFSSKLRLYRLCAPSRGCRIGSADAALS